VENVGQLKINGNFSNMHEPSTVYLYPCLKKQMHFENQRKMWKELSTRCAS